MRASEIQRMKSMLNPRRLFQAFVHISIGLLQLHCFNLKSQALLFIKYLILSYGWPFHFLNGIFSSFLLLRYTLYTEKFILFRVNSESFGKRTQSYTHHHNQDME